MIHRLRSLVSPARAWWLALSGASFVSSAHASESTEACLAAYEAGQRARHEGNLVGAADEFLVCGGPACPVRMQRDCQRWYDDVERSIPAVVFRVRGIEGKLLRDVHISIDGAAPRRLDGRALLMNPGEHEVVFEAAGYRPLRTPVFVTEGEKLEPRELTLESAWAAPPHVAELSSGGDVFAAGSSLPAREPPRASLAWPLAMAALGVAGGAGFVYFGVAAKHGESELERCTPDCSQSQVDAVKGDYLVSNVSLGVSLVGLVGAGVWLLLAEPEPSGAHVPSRTVRLGATPSWELRF